jgi:hypothetical protein
MYNFHSKATVKMFFLNTVVQLISLSMLAHYGPAATDVFESLHQAYAVSTYFKTIGHNASFFNRTGSGFPDVAAQVKNCRGIDQGVDNGYQGHLLRCSNIQ